MTHSLLKTTRFRIAFGIWWWSWAELQTLVLTKAGYTWKTALTDSGISNVLLGGVVLLVAVSLQYYTPQKNRYGYLFSLCAALSLLWLFSSRFLLLLILNEETAYAGFFSQTLLIRGATGFLVISCMALIAVLWYTIRDQQESEKRKTEAERLSKEAELNNLRQQMQPHFLFNSLNSINALIHSRPEEARRMVHQLSDFLRGTLKQEEDHFITLKEELSYLKLYLDIEKVRFGHRLGVEFDTMDDAISCKMPPMLLQPLMENAIKFGLYGTTGEVKIGLRTRLIDHYLVVAIMNPYDPDMQMPEGTGFGLKSIRRRLYLLFGRNDLVEVNQDKNVFVVIFRIPQTIAS